MGKTAKNADFRPINRYISETIEDRQQWKTKNRIRLGTIDEHEWPLSTVRKRISLLQFISATRTVEANEDTPIVFCINDRKIVQRFTDRVQIRRMSHVSDP